MIKCLCDLKSMVNLSEVDKLCLLFQSIVGCGGMVSLFEQLNLIGDVKIMTRILKYSYFTLSYFGIGKSWFHNRHGRSTYVRVHNLTMDSSVNE